MNRFATKVKLVTPAVITDALRSGAETVHGVYDDYLGKERHITADVMKQRLKS